MAGFFAEYGREMIQSTREHMVLTLISMLIAESRDCNGSKESGPRGGHRNR